jgi:hypothetical protein
MRRAAITIVCLAVVVIGAVGFYSWRHPSIFGHSTGEAPSLVSQLPPGAPFVLYADVAALRKATFLAKIAAMAPAPAQDPDYTEFVRATGFDYSRDLDRVAITVLSSKSQVNFQPEVWTLAEGRFDQQKIQAYALRTGKSEVRDGKTYFVIDAGSTGNEVALRFLSQNRIEIISRAKQSSAPTPSQNSNAGLIQGSTAAISDHISRVSGAAVFVVFRTDSVPKDLILSAPQLNQIAGALQNVQWISVAVTPEGENLRVILEGECGSSMQSTQLQLGLETLRLIGRGMLSDSSTRRQFTPQGLAALDRLVRDIDISHDGPHVRITAVITPDMLTSFAAPTPNQAPVGAPAPRSTPPGH